MSNRDVSADAPPHPPHEEGTLGGVGVSLPGTGQGGDSSGPVIRTQSADPDPKLTLPVPRAGEWSTPGLGFRFREPCFRVTCWGGDSVFGWEGRAGSRVRGEFEQGCGEDEQGAGRGREKMRQGEYTAKACAEGATRAPRAGRMSRARKEDERSAGRTSRVRGGWGESAGRGV